MPLLDCIVIQIFYVSMCVSPFFDVPKKDGTETWPRLDIKRMDNSFMELDENFWS